MIPFIGYLFMRRSWEQTVKDSALAGTCSLCGARGHEPGNCPWNVNKVYGKMHTMPQSRRASFVEAVVGTLVGFFVTLGLQLIIFPRYNIHTNMSEDMQIVGIFTIASVLRGYILRRCFNSTFWKDIILNYRLRKFIKMRKLQMKQKDVWSDPDQHHDCKCVVNPENYP
jgi:hypothetical protein